ncbi:MAG: ATP citrate lyase citrate-binding domain-containing protein [Candidatus Roizmanbacteria bacterium]
MARIKLTEYAAKSILSRGGLLPSWLGLSANAHTTAEEIALYFGNVPLVVKVDQGIKQRGKKGLMKVSVTPAQAVSFITDHSTFETFLIEKAVPHDPNTEQYLSLERVRDGFLLLYSHEGGIEIEDAWESIKRYILPTDLHRVPPTLHAFVTQLISLMNMYDWSFIEINPLVITDQDTVHILDAAVLTDDTAPIGQSDQIMADGTVRTQSKHSAEQRVAELQKNTASSLKLTLLNPDGAVWMLLSGGGASLVLADEVADAGYGNLLGNYGEYSGNPRREDVEIYTRIIIEALLKSTAPHRVLVIAGGVANFTDIYATLLGVIDGIRPFAQKLNENDVSVFVRRGGPNQKKGLALIEQFLTEQQIAHEVSDQRLPLTEVIHHALKTINHS